MSMTPIRDWEGVIVIVIAIIIMIMIMVIIIECEYIMRMFFDPDRLFGLFLYRLGI